ncbi:MAG: recombinase [Flavobacterium sp.]|nr:recombinase [Flavobacterium sp.]
MKFPKFSWKKAPRQSPAEYLQQQCREKESWQESEDDLEILVQLVNLIRPSGPYRVVKIDLSDLLLFLTENPDCAEKLSSYLRRILHRKMFNKFLSDAAILQDADFLFEVRKRLQAKILPYQPQKDRLEFVLNQVFYLATDNVWVEKIPYDQIEELVRILELGTIYSSVEKYSPMAEVLVSMGLIIQRISGRAMETEVIKMVPEFDDLESPFTAFEMELLQIEDRIRTSEEHYISASDLSYRQLSVLHRQCEDFVDKAFANSTKYGISLRVNQGLLKIRQQLERLKVLMPLLTIECENDKIRNSIILGRNLIKYNCYKNNVRKFIGESTQLISYEITQHTAKTGENYITHGRREYFKMLKTALGGGIIVGILCIIKLLMSKLDTSYFGHAITYSLNYAFGFIAIYLLGFTLATKQPAMTAAALVKALEDGLRKQHVNNPGKYHTFAVLFARVFRSQFIAFVGNVLTAFSVPLLLSWLIHLATGENLGWIKWEALVVDQSPLHSPALFHASIAGVYLFLSGIISGSVANRDKHNSVYYRIQEHPLLKKSLGRARAKKIAGIYEKKGAGVISNFWFGVFMGTTASIGLFLGLNIDVRHITFAAGNLALGIYGSGFNVPMEILYWSIVGVGLIGVMNFAVSFGLSLGLAFRSRNVPLSEIRFVMYSVWKHFKNKPLSFFFPTEKAETTVAGERQLKKG